MKTLLLFVFLNMILLSCNQLNNNNLFNDIDIENITDSLPVLNLANNKVLHIIHDNDILMVHYFNGNCSYCIAGIVERARYVDSVFGENTGLLFVTYCEDTASLNYYLFDRLKFRYPVLYDVKHQFYKWNKKEIDQDIKTFLVNNKGNILIQGDPMKNKEIEKRYFRLLLHN